MKFGPVPVQEAAGAILAHALRLAAGAFKKGRVLSAEDCRVLKAEGHATVVVARLEDGDVDENEAAAAVGTALRSDWIRAASPFTGRCNLFASRSGLLQLDVSALDRLNQVSETLTVATLAPFDRVAEGQMVATVKVIPFAVPRAALERCVAIATAYPILRLATWRGRRAGLIQTRLPGTRDSVLDKTAAVMACRLDALGGDVARETRCRHRTEEVSHAISELLSQGVELVLIAGASATVDRRDVLPAAIEAAGGMVAHFGMPVDPGNLLVLGYHGETPVLGLPGCARSPKYNGIDRILERIAAGLDVTGRDVMGMGAGGLLKEAPERPFPRAEAAPNGRRGGAGNPRVGALVLAAGRSQRMGDCNKLLAEIHGHPLLVHAADAARGSAAHPVIVVTGFERERVQSVLDGRDVTLVHAPDYGEGLSASLRHGLAALPQDIDGVVVCLGDMPRVTSGHIDKLITAFNPLEGCSICVPTFQGRWGNPVLWARRFFPEMQALHGDVGARRLIGEYPEHVCEVNMPDDGIHVDVDSVDVLQNLRTKTSR